MHTKNITHSIDTKNCLESTEKLLKEISKNFDIRNFKVDEPERKKQHIVSTLQHDPFRIFVGEEFGGFGGNIKDSLALLSLASYHSLQLTLVYGINWALFIQPLQKYGQTEVAKEILAKVCTEKKVGGLMITEPNYGSDALNMKTFNEKVENGFLINGQKHWGGLTGIADYWVLTTREKLANGNLGRDIDFFISDESQVGQNISVEKFYNTGGLEIITYGLNNLDIIVDEKQKFNKPMTGIKMLLDCLHRSRIQFSGMGMGYVKRMLDEGLKHCSERKIGNKNLIEYDKAKERLTFMQTVFTINSAMCHYASKTTQVENDLSGLSLEANCVKALLTDLMQESAQCLVQLKGGNGYIKDDIAGRAIMDSRPFQIFEGSNDILYMQIGEAICKKMRKQKVENLENYASIAYPTFTYQPCLSLLSQVPIPHIKDQNKLYIFGRINAYLFSLNLVQELSFTNFNQDLILQANLQIVKRIKALITQSKCALTPELLVNYSENSNWYSA